jgi:hypothetical protein
MLNPHRPRNYRLFLVLECLRSWCSHALQETRWRSRITADVKRSALGSTLQRGSRTRRMHRAQELGRTLEAELYGVPGAMMQIETPELATRSYKGPPLLSESLRVKSPSEKKSGKTPLHTTSTAS